jgi:acyl carrier protein
MHHANEAEVEEKIKRVVSEVFRVEEGELSEGTSFREDLEADSVDMFALIMALDGMYGRGRIEEDELQQIKTVGDTIRLIKKRVRETTP